VYHSAIHLIANAEYTPEQLMAWAPTAVDPSAWSKRLQGIRPIVVEHIDGALVGYADVQERGYIDHFFVSGH
jgi:putative acetyltransferase